MSLTLQRKDELIQQHHHAYSEWNVDLYGLIASIEAESVKEINDNQEYMKSQQTVISELQTERDALAITVQQMREALQRMLNGIPANANGEWVTDHHGFDGEYLGSEQHNPNDIVYSMAGIAQEALSLPDHSEIIKRHDAAVLRKAAEHLESYEYVFNAPPINYAEAHELRLMANELEESN